MITDDKFYDKAKDFAIVKDTDGVYATLDAYREKSKSIKTNKTEMLFICIHMLRLNIMPPSKKQRSRIQCTGDDQPIDNHFVQTYRDQNREDSFCPDWFWDPGQTDRERRKIESVLTQDETESVKNYSNHGCRYDE